MHLNLGHQAQGLGYEGVELAHSSLERSRLLAARLGDGRLEVEALDALAQLYEDRERAHDAVTLNTQALEKARRLEQYRIDDVLVNLEWREGRLAAKRGDHDLALAAYQRAVERVEAVRPDIPITSPSVSSILCGFEPKTVRSPCP